jgi:hypothetical protein
MDTAISLQFADGEYLFMLAFPQVLELERKCGSLLPDGSIKSKSIFQIFDELSEGIGIGQEDGLAKFVGGGAAHALDIAETIRLGLIGGNSCMVNGEEIEVGPLTAGNLVKEYVYARPLAEGLAVAWAIVNAAISGVQLKKKPEPTPESSEPLKPSEKA